MVYCGKPSKGCSSCRERKIRVSLGLCVFHQSVLPSTQRLTLTRSRFSAINKSLVAVSAKSASSNVLDTGIWWTSCSEMRARMS